MKPVRKMKDFSIESILSDTFVLKQNEHCKDTEKEKCRKRSGTDLKVNVEETTRATNEESNFVSAINLRKRFEINCDTCLKEHTAEERETSFRISSTESLITAICINSRQRQKKLNFTTACDGKSTKNCENTSGFLVQEKLNLNFNGTNTVERIGSECELNSTKLQEEFNVNYRDIDKSNCWRNFKINNQEKIHSERNSKRNQRKFDRCRKKQIEDFNGDLNGGVLGNQSKCLEDNLSRQLEGIKSQYLLPDNSNRKLVEYVKDETKCLETTQSTKELEWLQFTRYKPPKIRRKSTVGKNKRKASLQPRIPFSTFQLDFLAQKFRDNAYLSRNDVLDISIALKLPSKKVKIWFQNRRARERHVLSFDREI
ncbi:uncharacterized protein LOC143347668 [Colletes latitarsis]|uniref:uncharacterized protein LOC143347668 n=1 Tax=Colletes latitarsis TaxID=2605962 RepID=UPI004035444F